MRIIGHRGASSLALENTVESIRAAVQAGVDGVEFDIRLSADGQFFLSHDPTLERVSGSSLSIRKSSDGELGTVRLNNGETVVSLAAALEATGSTPALIEAKAANWAEPLRDFIVKNQPAGISVISFNHQELIKFHELMPTLPCYLLERTKPFEAIQLARHHSLKGVDLNFWLLNPFTYWYARYYKLEVIVYSVNNRWVAWYFKIFFPATSLTTDVPQRMQHLRS